MLLTEQRVTAKQGLESHNVAAGQPASQVTSISLLLHSLYRGDAEFQAVPDGPSSRVGQDKLWPENYSSQSNPTLLVVLT